MVCPTYYKYTTIGLALALFLVPFPYWVWLVVDIVFIDDASVPGHTPEWLPEPWSIHYWEDEDITEAMYDAVYTDCVLEITKGGTGTATITVDSLLVCAHEETMTTVVQRGGQQVEFDVIPADFTTSWIEEDDCTIHSRYMERGDSDTQLQMVVTCGG